MLDEHGFNWEEMDQYSLARHPMVAVLPHPLHGRLVEMPLFVAGHLLTFKDCWYRYNWRDRDTVFYSRCVPEKTPQAWLRSRVRPMDPAYPISEE